VNEYWAVPFDRPARRGLKSGENPADMPHSEVFYYFYIPAPSRWPRGVLKPAITVYSGGSNSKTKRFDSVISAAFWAGVDYADEDINSVKIRQPGIADETDLIGLIEFATLLVQRQINFSVEFPSEPRRPGSPQAGNEDKSRIPNLESEGVDIPGEFPTLKNEKP